MPEPLTEPSPPTPPPPAPAIPSTVSAILLRLAVAFTFEKFRNLWLAAFTSALGTWMQRLAKQLLILNLTGSAFILGLDTFFAEIPLLLFTLVGGVVADPNPSPVGGR